MKRDAKISIAALILALGIHLAFILFLILIQRSPNQDSHGEILSVAFVDPNPDTANTQVLPHSFEDILESTKIQKKIQKHNELQQQVNQFKSTLTQVHKNIESMLADESRQAKEKLKESRLKEEKLKQQKANEIKKNDLQSKKNVINRSQETKEEAASRIAREASATFTSRIQKNFHGTMLNKSSDSPWVIKLLVTLDIAGNVIGISIQYKSNDVAEWFIRDAIRTIKKSGPYVFPREHYNAWQSNTITIVRN